MADSKKAGIEGFAGRRPPEKGVCRQKALRIKAAEEKGCGCDPGAPEPGGYRESSPGVPGVASQARAVKV